jgi:cobalt-precorrin 5A hydrolase
VLADNWSKFGGRVVVAASGIVVRLVAPLLADKTVDPAVVVVDQQGRYAVSLVGGHLGGANDLAERVAGLLGGQAVITTATDGAGKPSLEVLASETGMVVENLKALSRISRGLLEGETIRVHDPEDRLRPALEAWENLFMFLPEPPDPADDTPLVWVGYGESVFPAAWLLIRPLVLAVGLGCNRGTALKELEDLVTESFARWALSLKSISVLASIEAKQDEPGLLDLAEKMGKRILFFSVEELSGVKTPNPSGTVEKHMGVGSVCEAAALLAAGSRRLLITKQKSAKATLAVALAD